MRLSPAQLLIAIIAASVVGCGGDRVVVSSAPPLYVLRYGGIDAPTAGIEGTIRFRNGCIWID
ncbi:MAG: hypothetical protein M3082_06550, partial [Candidatus Dormibacteraeota bacterium]|nr:hypothetical protein [Candidatus Dormibacteraeota bacterium]